MDSRKVTDPLNRGMVGGLLGVPAELGAMFLNGGRSIGNLANRLAGVNAPPAPMVENPVYGQEWWGNKMQQAGMVSPQRNKLAEFGAGLLDPSGVAKAPALAKGLFALGDPATTKMLGGLLGATVWHGSPHKFDKFDSSKIGTGEGAQAYGHGLYLAENPSVAESYKNALSMEIDGAQIPQPRNYEITTIVQRNAGDFKKMRDELQQYATNPNNLGDNPYSFVEDAEKIIGAIDGGRFNHAGVGSLYKVDLPDEDIARMLDWDKPMSEQSPEVQDIFGGAARHLQLDDAQNLTGKDIYRRMHEAAIRQGKAQPASVKEAEMVRGLRQAGIPGIRYLDGGSRGTGSGSSNFVVFPGNENRLKILERNGQPLK